MAQCWSHILSTSAKHSIVVIDEGALLRLVHVLRAKEIKNLVALFSAMAPKDVMDTGGWGRNFSYIQRNG